MDIVIINPNSCVPENCPLEKRCPVGPTPGISCKIKVDYLAVVTTDLSDMFKSNLNDPDISIKLQYMLIPLFEQLLHVKMAYTTHNKILMGKGVNPLLREVRQIIESVTKVLSTMEVTGKKTKVADLESANGKNGYYEMLFNDGVASVEHSTGFSEN